MDCYPNMWDVSELVLLPNQLAVEPFSPVIDARVGSGSFLGLAGSDLDNYPLNVNYLVQPPEYSFGSKQISPSASSSSLENLFDFDTEFYNLASTVKHNDYDDLNLMNYIDYEFENNVNVMKKIDDVQHSGQLVDMSHDNHLMEQDLANPSVVMDLLRLLDSKDVRSDLNDVVDPDLLNSNLFLAPKKEEPFENPNQNLQKTQALPSPSVNLENQETFQVDSFIMIQPSFHPMGGNMDKLKVNSELSNDSNAQDAWKINVVDLKAGEMSPKNETQTPESFCSNSSPCLQMLLVDNSSSSDSSSDINEPYKQMPSDCRPEKRRRLKEQNKTAALKYRQRKRQEQDQFNNECLEIERKNSLLKLKADEILKEINYLKSLFVEISAVADT